MSQTNRYPGKCEACNQPVKAGEGQLENIGRYHNGRRRTSPYKLWCSACFKKSDNSGQEDHSCGDRAYEDQCAAACGMGGYGW